MPTYRQDVSLSPQAQQALDASLGAQTNISKTAQQLSGNLASQLGQPLDWSQQQNYLNNITSQALDKSWDRQAQQFETDLVNKGIRSGSTAYRDQIGDFRNDRSTAYNNAGVQNYNTALQSQLALRAQSLNELTGLLGAGQVQTPQFGGTPQTDIAGITNAAYNQQLQSYNASQSQLGGLFSAGASLIPLFSDERLKENIHYTGEFVAGVPLARWEWVGSGVRGTGVIAQDVEVIHPDLVDQTHISGYKRVWYNRLSERDAAWHSHKNG